MTKSELRRARVLSALTKGPKDGLTMVQIQNRTGLTFQAIGRAIRHLREDPTVVFVTVPTASGGYRYMVAATVGDIVPGAKNQLRHLRTRALSWISMGEAIEARATDADEMRLGSRMVTFGQDAVASIDRMVDLIDELG